MRAEFVTIIYDLCTEIDEVLHKPGLKDFCDDFYEPLEPTLGLPDFRKIIQSASQRPEQEARTRAAHLVRDWGVTRVEGGGESRLLSRYFGKAAPSSSGAASPGRAAAEAGAGAGGAGAAGSSSEERRRAARLAAEVSPTGATAGATPGAGGAGSPTTPARRVMTAARR
ncbi:MAG: hypothetical protein A3H43_03970 [Gammaproteobacteria bacterium RIFCSPLOWO2_02_FULL_42_9]|nr:MAG: hypothetical protein A3H43_03970 [Gammaproteobacteria bacterium RIFCSPLOWO2_02_FULL_42_9]